MAKKNRPVVENQAAPEEPAPNSNSTVPLLADAAPAVAVAEAREPDPNPAVALLAPEPGEVASDDIAGDVSLESSESPAADSLPPPEMPPESAPISDPVRIMTLDLPLVHTPAYAQRTLRELDRPRAAALRRLADGLAHEGAKVDGKPVRNPDQALAWLLDQLV